MEITKTNKIDQMDDHLRRAFLATIKAIKHRFPNDYVRILAEIAAGKIDLDKCDSVS